MRQHGSSQFIDAFMLSDMSTLNEARQAAMKLLISRSPEDKKVVKNALERYSGELKSIAIN